MKTKSTGILLITAMSLMFAATASASPPGKGSRIIATFDKPDQERVERKVVSISQKQERKRVGPRVKSCISRH